MPQPTRLLNPIASTLARFAIRAQTLLHSRRDERGLTYLEYITAAAVVLVVLLAAIQLFFGGIAALFQRLTDRLNQMG
jgi:Flp pilus assembly pilin Flp